MIDVRLLRTELDAVQRRMARRGDPELMTQLDAAAILDGELRDLSAQRDDARRRVNELSKQVGHLRRTGETEKAEAAMAESRACGEQEAALTARAAEVEQRLRDVLLRIPNIPSDLAPDGVRAEDNPVVTGPINLPDAFADHQRVPHWESATALGILDNERAAKISGAMFTMQRGLGATLSRALCQLALDRNADAFEEIRPPTLVTTATLTATGQLPKFADDAFAIERDDLWCIPTAEVPLTSIGAGEVLAEAELPMRFMAYTPCYRREAGSAGRETRGMLRSHEFDKVEVLAYATADQAPGVLDELLARAEGTVAALGLPYRIIEICTGDLGQSHHRSFDLEVYAPGTDAWLEVSSVSWFSDYQARRADIRYRPEGERGTLVAHTLNGSALAVPRVWAAIIENHRQADGSIALPEALWPYLRGHRSIPPRAPMSLADRRSEYDCGTLERSDLSDDPFAQWWSWYTAAAAAGEPEPNAMSLATVGDDGLPDARIVLVRGVDERGFAFYTNLESAKARQLLGQPVAAATFAWLTMHRQVRLRGAVEPVETPESDAYYASRPRESRIGAWASPQSRVLTDRAELDALVAAVEARFLGEEVPRPPHWGGLRVVPLAIEFWQGRPNRLHDRFRYRRDALGGAWVIERLAP